jgi:hypothetical protein
MDKIRSSKVLCIEMTISDFNLMQLKDDVNYQDHIKHMLCHQLAEELFKTNMAKFTYEPNGYVGGATVKARFEF